MAAAARNLCSELPRPRRARSDGPGLSKAHFRWGQALLLSRAHSGDGKPFALVPALDLLNHAGSAAGASVRFDTAAAAFELVAERAHAPGAHEGVPCGCWEAGTATGPHGEGRSL